MKLAWEGKGGKKGGKKEGKKEGRKDRKAREERVRNTSESKQSKNSSERRGSSS